MGPLIGFSCVRGLFLSGTRLFCGLQAIALTPGMRNFGSCETSMRDYLALTKPRITWLIVISAGIGYFFGLPAVGGWMNLFDHLDLWKLIHTLTGVGLIASGTAALNQWCERDSDARMRRTAGRPIPAGRVTAGRALLFGITLSIAGLLQMTIAVNALSGLLGMLTLLSYLLVYTPLKQKSWLCTTVGAVPGAMPPLIGFAAAHGSLAAGAWALLAILFLWQFPHFYAIAWVYREDYGRAGIRMLPVVEPDGRSTARQMVLTGTILIPASLLPALLGMTGSLYLGGAIALGIWYLSSDLRVAAERTRARARGVLLASVMYLPALYALMLLDRVWQAAK